LNDSQPRAPPTEKRTMELIKRIQQHASAVSSSSYSHSSSYVQVLRTLLKQKEEIADKQSKEIEQLRHLLSKQQRLLNELNEDNMTLQRSLSELRSREESEKGSNNNNNNSSATSYYYNSNRDDERLTSDE
jgi:septal ring factor EnvC (AmiA/AmiB activator)